MCDDFTAKNVTLKSNEGIAEPLCVLFEIGLMGFLNVCFHLNHSSMITMDDPVSLFGLDKQKKIYILMFLNLMVIQRLPTDDVTKGSSYQSHES